MKGSIAFVVLSVLLLLAACAPKPTIAPPASQPVIPATAPAAAAPATTDAAVSSIDTGSAQVDQVDKDFDTSSLDKLDTDIQSIDNLDLG